MASLTEANTNFSLDLFNKISENNRTGNVFFSPLSISSALAMVTLGAGGDTAKQMAQSLHFHRAQGDVHVGFSKLMAELNKEGAPYALSLANRLYGEQSYAFVEAFLGDTKRHYEAELEAVDFISDAEAARVNINSWVEKQTQKKIRNLLAEGVVDDLTRLVLVNAIYFKGNWESKFRETSTRDAQFKLSKTETKPVRMMHQKAKFPLTFIPEANCQILELPYVGRDLSMLVLLPNDMEAGPTGLEKLEKELTYENFVEWTRPDMMDKVEVHVGLPRFKMEETYDLRDVLGRLGVVDAFDARRCNFSAMSPNDDLVLSKVVHKAFVEVNEEGTEAAAATAAVMMMRCARITPTFVADRPFLFFIRHNPTLALLFHGRYCSP